MIFQYTTASTQNIIEFLYAFIESNLIEKSHLAILRATIVK